MSPCSEIKQFFDPFGSRHHTIRLLGKVKGQPGRSTVSPSQGGKVSTIQEGGGGLPHSGAKLLG